MGSMLPYIAAPWILWVCYPQFHGPTDASDEVQSVWWSQIGGSCLGNWWLKRGIQYLI